MSYSRKTVNLITLLAFTASLLLTALPVAAHEATLDIQPAPDIKRSKTIVSVTATGVFTYPVTQSGNKAPGRAVLSANLHMPPAKAASAFLPTII